MTAPTSPPTEKIGWRVAEWHPAVGISRAQTYELIKERTIESVRAGGVRIILTSPRDYLYSLRETV